MSILKKASREATKIKMAITGASGSGKTYSALLMAYGLCGDWSKIAVLDTENGSANLYSHLGEYNVLDFTSRIEGIDTRDNGAFFDPRRYAMAIRKMDEEEGIDVLIIDSISHEWEGKGGCLELVEAVAAQSTSKNSYTAWGKVTPLHNDFLQSILQSKKHVICTMRSKTDYALEVNDKGRATPRKVGLKPITREGADYEFTIVLDVDQQTHTFTASKDRTGLFDGRMAEKITVETGKEIAQWCKA